jgi:hypothetical protein
MSGPVYPYREDRHLDAARTAAATMVSDCLDEARMAAKGKRKAALLRVLQGSKKKRGDQDGV